MSSHRKFPSPTNADRPDAVNTVSGVHVTCNLVNPHQRCGYSDSPFARKDTFLYCRVQKWVGGAANRVTNKLYPRKRHFFVIEKYIEDARQEEKDVPDLLEAIMRPTCLVKEELRQNLMKMSQFRPEITKIRV